MVIERDERYADTAHNPLPPTYGFVGGANADAAVDPLPY